MLCPTAPVRRGLAAQKRVRVCKRQQSRGEVNSSSRYNMPVSAVYGPLHTSNARSTWAAVHSSSQPPVSGLLWTLTVYCRLNLPGHLDDQQ